MGRVIGIPFQKMTTTTNPIRNKRQRHDELDLDLTDF
jgi:hypothetical protein